MGEGIPGRLRTLLPLEIIREEWTARVGLPYKIVTLDLAAAGSKVIAFRGTALTLLAISGAGTVNVRIGKVNEAEQADAIPFSDVGVLLHAYEEVAFSWEAAAGVTATFMLGWDVGM